MIYFGGAASLRLRVLHEVHLLTRTPVTPVLCSMISPEIQNLKYPRKRLVVFFEFTFKLFRSSFDSRFVCLS